MRNRVLEEARMGELLMLVGPSGCGKTTLLSVIAGNARHGSRRGHGIRFAIASPGQESVTQFRAANIGFIFLQYNLIPTLNCIEDVSVPLRTQGATVGRIQMSPSLRPSKGALSF